MAKEDLLVNLELDSGKFKSDVEDVSKAIKENHAQNEKLDKAVKDLQDSFAGLASQIKSVDKDIVKNQRLMSTSVGILVDTAKAVNSSTEAYDNLKATVDGLSTSFHALTQAVQTAENLFQILNNLTDPDFLIRLSKMLLLLSTIARIRGFNTVAEEVKGLSESLEKGALFFAQFRKEGALTLESLSQRAELYNQIKDSTKTAALAIAGLTAVGVITGLNDVLVEFGVVTKSISQPLIKLPKVISEAAAPFVILTNNIKQVSKAGFTVVDSFSAMVFGGRDFTTFLSDIPKDISNFEKSVFDFRKVLRTMAKSIPPFVEGVRKDLAKLDTLGSLFGSAARTAVHEFTREMKLMRLTTFEPYVIFENIPQTMGMRFSRAFSAFLRTDLVKLTKDFGNALTGGMLSSVSMTGKVVEGVGSVLRSVSSSIASGVTNLLEDIAQSKEFPIIISSLKSIQSNAGIMVSALSTVFGKFGSVLSAVSGGVVESGKLIAKSFLYASTVVIDTAHLITNITIPFKAVHNSIFLMRVGVAGLERSITLTSSASQSLFSILTGLGKIGGQVFGPLEVALRIGLMTLREWIVPFQILNSLASDFFLVLMGFPPLMTLFNSIGIIKTAKAFNLMSKEAAASAVALNLVGSQFSEIPLKIGNVKDQFKAFAQYLQFVAGQVVQVFVNVKDIFVQSLSVFSSEAATGAKVAGVFSRALLGIKFASEEASKSFVTTASALMQGSVGILSATKNLSVALITLPFNLVSQKVYEMSASFVAASPILQRLVFNLQQVGAVFKPMSEEIVGTVVGIIRAFIKMSTFIPTILSDVALAFKGIFTSGTFAQFAEQFSGSMKSAFALTKNVATLGMDDIGKVLTDRGANLVGILGHTGRLFSQVWRTSMDDALIAMTRFELVTNGTIMQTLGNIGKAAQVFGKGFVTGFTAPLNAAGEAASLFGKTIQTFAPSLLTLTEAGHTLGPGLLGVGTAALKSDKILVKLGGTALIVAGIFLGGLATAFSFLLRQVGGFIEAIGTNLIHVMTEFEEKFAKSQIIVQAFEFTIVNFGKAIGTEVAGSLDQWNKKIGEIVDTTQFSLEEVRKSVQLLVAEGQVVGLTLAQAEALLSRSADLAAAKGAELSNVVDSLIGGISGQIQATRSLGINLTEHAVQHSKFSKELQKEGNLMSETTKTNIRYNEVIGQSAPLAGFAAKALGTIHGANLQLEKSLERVQIALGKQGVLTRAYIVTLTSMTKAFLDLPQPIIDFIGVFIDLFGVVSKVLGLFLQYALLLSSLSAFYGILNTVITTSVFVQTQLTAASTYASAALGVQAVAVTSLNTAFLAFLNIIRGSLLLALRSLAGMLLKTALAIGRVTLAVLTSPLFWKATLIVSGIIAITMAVQSLMKDLKQLQPEIKAAEDDSKGMSSALEDVSVVAKQAFNAVVELAKVAVIGLLKLFRLLQLSITGWRMLYAKITGNAKAVEYLNEKFDETIINLGELGAAGDKALVNIASTFDATATAAAKLGQSVKKIDFKSIYTDFSSQAKKLDLSFNLDLTTDPFDKALARVQRGTFAAAKESEAAFKVLSKSAGETLSPILLKTMGSSPSGMAGLLQVAIDKSKKLGEETTVLDKALETLSAAVKESESAQIALSDLRIGTTKELTDQQRQAAIQSLRDSGQLVEAVKLENAEKVKAFNLHAKGLDSILKSNVVRSATTKEINKTRAALEKQNIEALKAAQIEQDSKIAENARAHLEIIQELKKSFIEVQKVVLEGNGDEVGLAKLTLGLQLAEIDALAKSISLQKEFTSSTGVLKDEYQAVLDNARELAQIKFDEIAPFTVGDLVGVLKSAYAASEKFAIDAFDSFKMPDFKAMELPSLDDLKDLASSFGDTVIDAIMNIDLKDVGETLLDGLSLGMDFVSAMFDPAVIGGIADMLSETLQKLPEELMKAFEKLDQVIGSFIKAFPELVSKLMDALPGILSKIMAQIPALIDALATAFGTFLEKLPAVIAVLVKALPGIIVRLMAVLPGLIVTLAKSLGLIIKMIVRAVPDIIKALVDGFPEVAAALIEGMIALMGDLVDALIQFIMDGGIQKIVGALLRAIPKIAMALVNGIVRGLKTSMGTIFGGVHIPKDLAELPGKFSKGIKDLAKNAGKEASKLFKVIDLEASAAAIGKKAGAGTGKELAKVADIMAKQKGWLDILGKILGLLFNPLVWLDLVLKTLQWIGDKIIFPLFGLILKAFQWVIDNILTPLSSIVKAAFQGAIDLLTTAWLLLVETFRVVWDAAMLAFQAVVDLLKGIWDGLKAVFEDAFSGIKKFFDTDLKDSLTKAFSGVFDTFSKVGTQIWDSLSGSMSGGTSVFSSIGTSIFNALASALGGIGKVVSDALGAVSPSNLLAKIFQDDKAAQGKVEGILGINIPYVSFAKGGLVPGSASVAGDSLLNDKILAMLSPGEAIVPRSVMDDPQLAELVRSIIDGKLKLPQYALGNPLAKVAKSVTSTVQDPLAAVRGGLGGLADAGKQGFAGLGALSEEAYSQLSAFLSGLDPSLLWDKVLGKVGDSVLSMMQAHKFHQGGMVPAFSGGGEVPAMLKTGEFVLNRQAAQSLGMGTLGQMNRGNMPGNLAYNFDIKLEVNSDGLPDEAFIRQKLIPAMKKELKAASVRGEFLISQKGIRET